MRPSSSQSGHPIASIDVGGGLGVRYRHGHDQPVRVNEYAAMLRATFADFGGTLVLEPGRYLVAEAGVLMTRVIRVKPAPAASSWWSMRP